MAKHTRWITILVLALIPLLMVLGNSVLIPGLPTMQAQMHVSKFQISLLITMFSVPAAIAIPIAGFLSDRLSRKWIVVPSLLLFGAGGILAGIVAGVMKNPYAMVVTGRAIQGVGASGTAPIAMAWVGDLFSGSARSKVLGLNEAGNALGKVVSPLIGAAVAYVAWFAVFFIFPVLCLPLAAAVWWLVPEKANPSSQRQTMKEYLSSVVTVFRSEGDWLSAAYLSGATALFTLFGVLFYLSDLLERKYGMEGVVKGLVLAIPLLVLTSTSFLTGSFIKKRKSLMKWLVVSGLGILSASLIISVWTSNRPWTLVASLCAGALGTGLVLPSLNMLITSAVSQEHRGIVTSFYGSVRFLGVAFGPPVFTWLLAISVSWMFFAVAGVALACALYAGFMIRPSPDGPRSGSKAHTPTHTIRGRHKARF